MSLTPEQAAVIEQPFQNKLVCALPGSGKTHTTISLADRILAYPHTSILMVTFTNAASTEMQTRIEKRLGPTSANRVKVKTFAKIMIEQHRPLLAGRRLILGGELDSYINRVFKKLSIDWEQHQYFRERFDAYGRDLNWKYSPGIVTHDAYFELMNMLAIYQRVDLNTIAKEVVHALHAGTIKPLPFNFIIVDEFQDTDLCQYSWLLAHRDPDRFMTVVGDDDQSIYSWRGAIGYQNMMSFVKDFSASTYILNTCFRCSPYILGTAQVLVEHNQKRIAKDMRAAKEELGHVGFVEYHPPSKQSAEERHDQEYNLIVDHIAPDYANWTVLARTNLELDTLETYLSNRGIPALRLGGKSIFDSPDVLSAIKLIYGLVYTKNITPVIEGLAWLGECEDVLQSVHATGRYHGFSSASLNGAQDYTVKLQALSTKIAFKSQNDAGLSYAQSAFSIAHNHFEILKLAKSTVSNPKIKLGALALVERIFMNMTGDITQRAGALYELATKGAKQKNTQDRAGKVVLCTLTGSKGLEWPKVMIINVNEGTIPSIHEDDIDDKGNPSLDKLEEERRLLYVGMTRAEDELVLQFAMDKPSVFIKNLRPDIE